MLELTLMPHPMKENGGGRQDRKEKKSEKAVEDGDRKKIVKMNSRSSRIKLKQKVVSVQDESRV